MKQLFKLAIRNLWRNRRRSLLSVSVFAMGLVLILMTVAIMDGSHEKVIELGVTRTSGHIQIHYKGYQDNQILYNSLESDRINKSELEQVEGVKSVLYRITTAALLESGGKTRLVQIRGIDPEPEREYGGFVSALIRGDYINDDDPEGVYVGQDLAAYLKVDVGDDLFLLGEARDMSVAASRLHVRGIYHTHNLELDRFFMILPRKTAEEVFVMDGFLTEAVIMLNNNDWEPSVQTKIESMMSDEEEVIGWQKIIPDLKQMVLLDAAFGYLFVGILALVVTFGVLNTILTATMERRQEYAVMLALGEDRSGLFRQIVLEGLLLGAVAVVIGLMIGIPASLYFVYNPIPIEGDSGLAFETWGFEPVLRARLTWDNIIYSSLSFGVLAVLSSLWPAYISMKTDILKNISGRE